ncbi:restriction endonuclease [Poritiphilus flavus]|uniref:Restriction endonuclease type IV Mrr domain-containing protein n=1 Tax=Poritiphilus flavus TaxID=2697053 RepID=A0A6L9E7H4_9FLAO|nr:restriction endonuclease [Poritiphilus flavus]NAS10594.1 hypothetical protein [Poritiphilus flavus]
MKFDYVDDFSNLIDKSQSWWNIDKEDDPQTYYWNQFYRILEEECVKTLPIFRNSLKRQGLHPGTGFINNAELPHAAWWLRDCKKVDNKIPIDPEIHEWANLLTIGAERNVWSSNHSKKEYEILKSRFRAACRLAFNHPAWLHATLAWQTRENYSDLIDSKIILPENSIIESQLSDKGYTPESIILTANFLIKKGFSKLQNIDPYEFELLIGALLEKHGWDTIVTKKSRDGGIDVISKKIDPNIGVIKSIWQAKRYNNQRNVTLSEVRELAWAVDEYKASKGMIVTTSRLSRDAFAFVEQRKYKLGSLDGKDLSKWIEQTSLR